MINFNDFCTEIFQVLRAYGREMVLYDEGGNRVFEPDEARRFYMTGDNILISIQEDGDNSSFKMYLSPSINIGEVKGFIETLRIMATKANLLFHVKKFDKEIKPQDFATQASVNEHQEIKMNIMEGMYGTSKSSYLKMENARMIVRHGAQVKENVIGSRGRNIKSIFVENAQGERFLFPVNVLAGARAMTQHVNHGGTFADNVGAQIIRMAHDFRNLAKAAQPGMNKVAADAEAYPSLRESVMSAMHKQKLQFARIYEAKSYARELTRIEESCSLMEDTTDLTEKTNKFAAILGEGFDEAELNSLARLVEFQEVPVVEAEEDEQEEIEEDFEVSDEEEGVEESNPMLTPNNDVIREFEDWMEAFDPESMFGQEEAPELEERMAPEAGDRDMNDIKTELNAVKAQLSAMSPFDRGYGAARGKIKELEAELAKSQPYGKSTTVTDEAVEEATTNQPVSNEVLQDFGYSVIGPIPQHDLPNNLMHERDLFRLTVIGEHDDHAQRLGLFRGEEAAWEAAREHFAQAQAGGEVAEDEAMDITLDEASTPVNTAVLQDYGYSVEGPIPQHMLPNNLMHETDLYHLSVLGEYDDMPTRLGTFRGEEAAWEAAREHFAQSHPEALGEDETLDEAKKPVVGLTPQDALDFTFATQSMFYGGLPQELRMQLMNTVIKTLGTFAGAVSPIVQDQKSPGSGFGGGTKHAKKVLKGLPMATVARDLEAAIAIPELAAHHEVLSKVLADLPNLYGYVGMIPKAPPVAEGTFHNHESGHRMYVPGSDEEEAAMDQPSTPSGVTGTDDAMKQNQSTDLMQDIEAKKDDGSNYENGDIERMRQLAGMRK